MTSKNIIIAVVAVLVIAGVVVGLIFGLRTTGPAAPSTIKVGVDVPLTGKFGALGIQTLNGYKIAVKDINAAGGVYVKEYDKKIPLELIVLDDESDGTKVVENLETLHSVNDVVAYLGPAGSALHAAGSAIAEKNKTPYFGIGFGLKAPHTLGYRYVFAPFIKMDGIAKVAFQMLDTLPLADRQKLEVVIFEIAAGGGDEFAIATVKEAEARGIPVKYHQSFSPAATDFSSLINGAKAAVSSGAKVVLFSFPTPPQGPIMIGQMKSLGFDVAHNFMVRAPDDPNWSANTGSDGDYVINAMGWHNQAPWPGVAALNTAYNAEGYGTVADPLTGPAYACVQILADSIERAGNLDRTAIRDAVATFDGMTVAGPFTFNPDGTGNGVWMVYQVLNGKNELIWPAEYETKPWTEVPPWSARP